MKILMLSDVQRKGGAGIAAHRLARGLIGQGHEVRWVTPHPDAAGDIPTIDCRDLPLAARVVCKVAGKVKPGYRRAIDARVILGRLLQVVREYRPDVISVHNLHGADLPATLPTEVSRIVPVVWTLHDMWAFTGTCAYAMGCRAFESACHGDCPMADAYPASPAAQVPRQFEERVQALKAAGAIAFVTPIRWLADEARRGMLRDHDVRAIPNSVELDLFRPIDRDAARKALDLPLGRPVLVTAATPGDPRKGASVLHAALARLDRPNTIVLQLGGAQPDSQAVAWDHRALTSMSDTRLLRLAYGAADAHILPTLADNLPNTLLEAAACGAPTIGANVGGVGEAIVDGETGWLVQPDDPAALADRIGAVIDTLPDDVAGRRRACRRFAERSFALSLQAERYTQLFGEVTTRFEAPSRERRAA